jgi:GNAT superfamily N-acetyltransferase
LMLTKETTRRTFTLLGVGEVLIREASPEDAEGLRRMFSRCSRETIYLRFHLPLPSVPERVIGLLIGISERDGRALVAVDGDDEIVGHAMYVRDEASDTGAELAVVVEDGRQSRGLGTLMLSEIAEQARRTGVETLTFTTLAENRPMLRLARRVFPGLLCPFRAGTRVICVPLAIPLAKAGPGDGEGPTRVHLFEWRSL